MFFCSNTPENETVISQNLPLLKKRMQR